MVERARVRTIICIVAAVAIAASGEILLLRGASAVPPCASLKASKLASDSSEGQSRKVFQLTLKGGKVTGIDDTIRARRGDQLELQWLSDRSMTLHLHGYGIETRLAPNTPAAMIFKANLAGRFPVSEHRQGPGHHRAVLYLEILP